MTAKLYPDMSNEEYHSKTDALSKSMLSVLADCPARFKYQYIDGGKQEDTKSLRLGSAVHTLALEPEKYAATYHVLPEGHRMDARTDKHKEQIILADGKTMLKAQEHQQVQEMAEALTKNAYALSLLKAPGYVEASIFWEDADGQQYRCKPDMLRNDGLILDLKTCRSAKPSMFMRDAYNLHYHLSVAHTCNGYEKLYEKPAEEYVFIAIESEAPYLIECYSTFDIFDDLNGLSYLSMGQWELAKLIERYKICKASNNWPSYNDKITPMKAPAWAVNKVINGGEE